MVEKDESEQRIQELEEDIKVLNDREKEENSELERQVLEIHASMNICFCISFNLGLKTTCYPTG